MVGRTRRLMSVTLPEPTPPWWQTVLLVAGCGLAGLVTWTLGVTAVLEGFVPIDPDRFFLPAMGDLLAGVICLPLVARVHRRHTYAPALAVIVMGGFSTATLVGALYCFVTVVARFSWRRIAVTGAVAVMSTTFGGLVSDAALGEPSSPWWWVVGGTIGAGLGLLLGLAVRGRRATLLALAREAEVAQREQQLLILTRDAVVAQAQATERNRLAREVHDALSHELSVIAMHSGALEFRADLTAEQQRASAATIASAARRAGSELRRVITTLRDDAAREAPDDLRDLPEFARRVTSAGSPVTVQVLDGLALGEVSTSASQQVFRVIREALNNAVRHAPGQPVLVTVQGGLAIGLNMECRNPVGPTAEVGDARGAGVGLVGMAEIARLLGGTFSAGVEDTEYTVRLWVPWPG